jgi:mevalonate kinase
MIISELAAEAVTILTPFVASGAKKIVNAVGKVALEKLDTFITRLKQRWSGNPVAENTLQRFEKDPERYAPIMEDVLKEEMEQDEAFAQEVKTMVKEIGPQIKIVQKLNVGIDVTGLKAGTASRGKIDIEQDIKKGKNITGAEIDEIG